MRFVTSLALLFLLISCADVKILPHQISLEDTAWIQKGTTTRTEVEARFGKPNFEVPEYAVSTPETADTSTPRHDASSPATTTTISKSPTHTKATYVPSETSAVSLTRKMLFMSEAKDGQRKKDRFWVTYDLNNVVIDFGFAGPPPA